MPIINMILDLSSLEESPQVQGQVVVAAVPKYSLSADAIAHSGLQPAAPRVCHTTAHHDHREFARGLRIAYIK